MEPVESLLDFTTPSIEETDQLCKQMHESLPPVTEADWQGKMERVLAEQSRERAKLARASQQQALGADPVPRQLYKLHLYEDRTAVLVAANSSRDVQTVYEKPSYDSKKLGVEQRSVIEVAEQKDGWLRYYPRADDRSQQCWVAQSSENGRWELAPKQSSTALQMEFFVESSLELLMFALAKEQGLSELLLNCCRRFAGRLLPLALFESAGNIIEKSIDALIQWLTEGVATASAAGAADVVTILVQLTLARGSLPAILQLADFLSSHPDLLTLQLLKEMDKFSEIQNFEPAARALFRPPPGSLEHFAAEWEKHVIPAVRKSGGPEAEIMSKVHEGDGEAAENLVRTSLNEKAFAALWVPNLHRLSNSQDAQRFATSLKQLQEARHRLQSGCTSLDMLVLIFLHVEVVSLRIETSNRARAPVCVDLQAIEQLVQLLSSHSPVDKLLGDGSEATARRSLCACLLRLLCLNASRMLASRAGPLSESCADTLRQTLTKILALDCTKQSECSKIVETAADLFSVSQQFVLSSAGAKLSAVKDLVAKLLTPPVATTTFPSAPDQPELGKLVPFTVEVPAALKGCNMDIATPGLIKVPDQKSAQLPHMFVSTTALSGGTKHYLEVRLADSSPTKPSEACPQAIDLAVGIVPSAAVSGPLELMMTRLSGFHPVKGKPLAHGVEGDAEFFGTEWWKSSNSACAGDTVGLYLDTATGELLGLKNRKPIGTIQSPAEQQPGVEGAEEVRWMIVISPTHRGLHIEASNVVVRSIDEVAGLVCNDPPTHFDPGAIVERLATAVISEMARPAALKAVLAEEGSIEALGSLVDLLTYKALRGHHVSSDAVADSQDGKATWTWDDGKKHQSFEVTSQGTVARRTRGSRPDYAGIFGTHGFAEGVHEWDLKFDQRTDRVWVGVASENFPLGNDDTPDCVDAATGHLWYFRDNGEYGQNRAERRRAADFRIRNGSTYRFKLDCDEGTFSVYQQTRASSPGLFELAATVKGIKETVFPILYFDYETKVTLLEARSEIFLYESDGAVGVTLDQSLLSSAVVRAMRLLSDQSEPADVSRAVAVVERVFQCAQQIFVAIRESAVPESVTPFQMLEHCNLKELLSGAIALATTVINMRTTDGSSAALVLTDRIVAILTEIQATVDSCRDVLIDPSQQMRLQIREFAAAHRCDAVTAAFYVCAFGFHQAKIEYDKSGSKPAPSGYMTPVDEHWLIDTVDVISSCGGKCIATLCSGLKSFEEDFDVSLFTANCEAEVAASILERLDVVSVRQNWIGFPAPVLQDVEEISIKAMVAHCGLLHHNDSVECHGALLHIGREALQIKRSCQDLYRTLAAATSSDSLESSPPLTWETAAEGFLARARLILSHSGAAKVLSEPVVMNLRRDEDVFDWERDNASLNSLCINADKVRRFIQSDAVPSRVTEVLQSRRTSVAEAEAGYRYAIELLTAGQSHRQGLERSYTAPAYNTGYGQGQLQLSGNWHVVIESTAADGKVTKTESDYELCCMDQWIFGSCDKGVEVCGRVRIDKKVSDETMLEWTEVKYQDGKKRVVRRFEVSFNAAEKTLTGTGTTADETPKPLTISGQLKRVGMVASKMVIAGADGKSTSHHPILRGISLSQRQCGLLQSASKAFADLGPLSEGSVRESSDNLSRVVLSLLCTDASEQIREAAGRMLLTRLDDGGARFLASADSTRQVLVDAAAETSDEASTRKDVQSIFIATLLVKVARLSPMDETVLKSFVGAVLEMMRSGGDQTHTMRCMESLRASCHEPCVIAELQKQVNVDFFWKILHQRPEESDTSRSSAGLKLPVASVRDVSQVIRTVRSTLGDVCSTWDRAGWEDSDDFERNVREGLEKDPTCSEPCVVAKRLSIELADELVTALQAKLLETDENLLCMRQDDCVVVFLKGTEQEEETNDGQLARIQLVALQLLNMSLQPSNDALVRVLRFVEQTSPEGPFIADTITDSLSLSLRVNASMMLRNLISSRTEWADLFCNSFEQAAATTAAQLSQKLSAKSARLVVPVFAHLIVLGVPEVSGCGQPDGASGSIDYTLHRCARVLQDLLQRVLATSHSSSEALSSLSFCILRARLLKVVFEASSQAAKLGVLNNENIAAMAQLAMEPVDAPASVVVEALITKLHTLYPLCAVRSSPKWTLEPISTTATEPEPEQGPQEGVPPDVRSLGRSWSVPSITQVQEQLQSLRAQSQDIALPQHSRALDLPVEDLLGGQAGSTTVHGNFSVGQHVEYRSQSLGSWIRCIVARVHHDGALDLDREDGELHTRANPTLVRQMAVGYHSQGSVEKTVVSVEHDLAVIFARLCLFATDDGQTSCATLQMPLQMLISTASTLFLSGPRAINPLIQTRRCLSAGAVERVLLSRAAADGDESTGLRLLTLSRLYRPVGEQNAIVSSDSLEQLKHSFREYCRAAGLMSHYKQFTKILTSTGTPAASSSLGVEPATTYCVGELCQVEVQSGTAKGKWIYSRVISEHDRADMLNVFTFPDGARSGAHARVLTKHVRKCSVPTVQGLRALGADDLVEASVVEASEVDTVLSQIASLPETWEAPEPTALLFSSTNKSSRGDLHEGRSRFRAPRHARAGGVASEQHIKDSGVLAWRLKLGDCGSELAVVVGAAEVHSFDGCFSKDRAAPRRAEWAVTNSSSIESAHGAKRVTERFRANTVLRVELDLDSSPTTLAIFLESNGSQQLLFEKQNISTEHDKALFFGFVNEGFSSVQVDVLPVVMRPYNMELNEEEQRSERTLRASPSSADAPFHLWLAEICVNMERNSDEDNIEWMEMLAERLLVIWAHGEPKTKQTVVAVLARLPSSCLCAALAREPQIQSLIGESIGRQWKIAEREQRMLSPPYLQALLEVAYKAGLLMLPSPGDPKTSGSLAVQAMLSVIEPAKMQLLPKTASEQVASGLEAARRVLDAALEYACNYDCGFCGSFDVVERHELTCSCRPTSEQSAEQHASSPAAASISAASEATVVVSLPAPAPSAMESDEERDIESVMDDPELAGEMAAMVGYDGEAAAEDGGAVESARTVANSAETSPGVRRPSPQRFGTLRRQFARLRASHEDENASAVPPEEEPSPEPEPLPEPEPSPGLEPEPEPAPGSEPEPEPEPLPAPVSPLQPDPDIVAELRALGFPSNACARAAIATNNSGVQEGLEWCFEHVNDSDYNDALPEPDSLVPSTAHQPPAPASLTRTLSRTQIELLAADIVHWQWRSNSGWCRYSAELSRILEDAWEDGRPEVDLGGTHGWRVDMSAMEQRNTASTGNVRAVRRTVALPFTEPGSFGIDVVELDDAGRPATSSASTNVLVVETVDSNSAAERVSRAADVSLQGMILHEVGGTEVHSLLTARQLLMSSERPVTLVFGSNATGATQVMNCPGEHGLSAQRSSHGGVTCDVCGDDIDTGSEMLSCRQCDFDVCSSCAQASRHRARTTTAAAQEFRAAIKSYSICHELLAPGVPIPPPSWWEVRHPGWTKIPAISDLVAMDDSELLVRAKITGVDADKITDETLSSVEDSKQYIANLIVERSTLKYDFDAAFSESTWTVEMDTALVAFLQERAIVKKTTVAALTADDLFDEMHSESTCVSRYNDQYFCQIDGVTVLDGTVTLSFRAQGDNSLGALQGATDSRLKSKDGTIIPVAGSVLHTETATLCVGELSFKLDGQTTPCLFSFGSSGYSWAEISAPTAVAQPVGSPTRAEQSRTASKPDEEPTPDKAALYRNVSMAPVFAQKQQQDVVPTSPHRSKQVMQLADSSHAAIRARFLLLREWNEALRPALPLVDLHLFENDGHISRQLCICKGRLLPETKNHLIERALKLSASSANIPRVSLNISGPDVQVGFSGSVFGQMFQQLHGKHSLTNAKMNEEGEGQLWKVDSMRGEGALAFTDATDVGGHFRTSLRLLCNDLSTVSLPIGPREGQQQPLFIPTPNYVRGAGDGAEAASESYLPNPSFTTKNDLEKFEFVGTLCGAAARFTGFMELELPSLCWKMLLEQALDLHELHIVDVSTATYLESVLLVESEGAWHLRQGGEHPVRWRVRLANNQGLALRGDGSALVEFGEREEYCAAAEKAYLEQFKPQMAALASGFYQAFPKVAARLLTWRELQRRVCGLPDVDVSQLQRIAQFEGSYSESDDYIKLFWEVLRELSGQERKQLLGFVWGRSRLPVNCETPFVIDSSSSGDGDAQLPTSHTCMFQLHLPRYSSAAVLKERLLTAIQNAGQRGDVGGALAISKTGSYLEADGIVMKRSEEARSACLLKLPADGGHLETLTDFCERARVNQKLLQRCLAVNDMSQLLAMDLESVRAALDKRKLPGSASGVGGSETTSVAQLQRVRNRYEAMSMQQLKECCRDAWLDDTGLESELVERLVAFDAFDADGNERDLANGATQSPMQKADVARVISALAQAQRRWTADPLGGGGSGTATARLPRMPDESSDDEECSDDEWGAPLATPRLSY